MANGDSATLPMPPTTGPQLSGAQAPQDGSNPSDFLKMILQLGVKTLSSMQQQKQGQPQGQPAQAAPQVTPGSMLPIPPVTSPATLHTKADPMANVGSLPQPVAQPTRQGAGPSAQSSELLSKLDPRGAAVFSMTQGVSQFIQNSVQQREKKQQAEAQNAAQALMSALEGAKTTGDYSPAQHIFENNEALFNKVYKGWMQKAEEAKKENEKPKKEKKADPEIQGFEQGLAQYMGAGAAKQPGQPQPPSTLTGKSGAKYFMPQAAPQQAVGQQVMSSENQALRQDPNRGLSSQLSSDEQRQSEMGKAGLSLTPETQAKLSQYAVEYARVNLERKKSEDDVTKAQLALDTEVKKAGFASEEAQTKLKEANTTYQTKLVELDIAKQRGQIELQKAKNGGTVPASYRMRWQAASKAEELLNNAVTSKKPLDSQQINSLKSLLGAAGAANLAKTVPSVGLGSSIKNWVTDSSSDPKVLLKSLQDYKDSLKKALASGPSWLDSSSDDSDDSDVIRYDSDGNPVN